MTQPNLIVQQSADGTYDRFAANLIMQTLLKRYADKDSNTPVLATFPTGKTPQAIYQELAMQSQKYADIWDNLHFIQLDEFACIRHDNPKSYAQEIAKSLLDLCNQNKELRFYFNTMNTDPNAECKRIEQWLSDNGPLDLAVVGLGLNGHIGFNEPGSHPTAFTQHVAFDHITRQNLAELFGTIDDVPTHGFTLGLQTILDTNQIILLVKGGHKADMLKACLEQEPHIDRPASLLTKHPNLTIIADNDAASRL